MQLGIHKDGLRKTLLIVLLYFSADWFLNKFALGVGWTVLWPLNGLTLALLLRRPRKRWPTLLFAVELGTLLSEHLVGNSLPREFSNRLFSAFEVLLSATLLPPFLSMEDWLTRPRIVARVALSLLVGPAVSGVFWAACSHYVFHHGFTSSWIWWATPDMLGCSVTLPMALAVSSPEMRNIFRRGRAGRTALILLLSVSVSALIFSEGSYPLLFLLYPMLLYVDSKLSFAGASVSIFAASVLGVFCTVHGFGPFGHWSPQLLFSPEAALQIYLGFHAVALLPLSLLILERRNMAAQLQEANSRLTALSQQDSLTGIANRRAFDEAFEQAWDSSLQSGLSLSVLMIDIDKFKQYNDCNGHMEGDRCLVHVARALVRAARWGNNCVARFGGEEFVVLLPHSDERACMRMAEKLRRAIASADIPHLQSSWGLVTISVGCATISPGTGANHSDLIAQADAALYRAKVGGRNRIDSPLTATGDLRLIFSEPLPLAPQPGPA